MKIANLRDTKKGYRCDRGSYLGNPFDMGKDESKRADAVKAYGMYLYRFMSSSPTLSPAKIAVEESRNFNVDIAKAWRRPTHQQLSIALANLVKFKPDVLLCWCAPKECHCKYLVAYVEMVESGSSAAFSALLDG